MNTDIQVSEENRPWLRELQTVVKTLDAARLRGGLKPENEIVCLAVFSECVGKINRVLGWLVLVPYTTDRDPNSPGLLDPVIQQLRHELPHLRRIYEIQQGAWFTRDSVLEHGCCYARTWSDIVLQTAEQVEFLSRHFDAIRACEMLHESKYESGKVLLHLEIEFEHAGLRLCDLGTDSSETKEKKRPTIRASQLDRDRATFFQQQKKINQRVTQKEVAKKWAEIHNDECDEQAIRNSLYKVNNDGKEVSQRNKT